MENRTPTSIQEDVLTDHLRHLREAEKEGYVTGVKRGRNTLFWIAALIMTSQILIFYAHEQLNFQALGIILSMGVAFVLLGVYSYKKPFTGLLAGTILYVSIWTIDLACGYARGSVNVTSGISGILIRVTLTILLARALPDARKLENLLRESPTE
jgi:hypothetical protein